MVHGAGMVCGPEKKIAAQGSFVEQVQTNCRSNAGSRCAVANKFSKRIAQCSCIGAHTTGSYEIIYVPQFFLAYPETYGSDRTKICEPDKCFCSFLM